MITGKIHSIETFGAVDGPGLRFILFLKGCPLRCKYCHNPDTWGVDDYTTMTTDCVFQKVLKYKNFIKTGGITISGGEPLLQSDFCEELITLCKSNGIHTAIDTSGSIPLDKSHKAIDVADLILLDIKDLDNDGCVKLTNKGNENTLKTLEYCEKTNKTVWIRHVLVPGFTLIESKLELLYDYLKDFRCIEKIELLPYHTLGKYKWDNLNLKYDLEGVLPPSVQEIEMARKIFHL